MKSFFRLPVRGSVLALALALLAPALAPAFPPAPHHRLFGLVRNEFGEPLETEDAEIIFEAANGIQVTAPVSPGLQLGLNYEINIAIDSGIAPDNYKPTALKPTLPFRIRVRVGKTTYLPMEMVGDYAHLGEAAASTRIDLTLGVDADNDGLPDAWEKWLASQLGSEGPEAIQPNDDSDGDGIRNLDEYLAGTFAFDPEGGFRLNLVPRAEAPPILEFTVIKPRTYIVYSSPDTQTWSPVAFRVVDDGPDAPARTHYTASDVRLLRVEPVLPADPPTPSVFFKVQVQ